MHLVGHREFSPGESIRQGQAALERVGAKIGTFMIDIDVGGDTDCVWPNDRLGVLPWSIKDQSMNKCSKSWPLYIFKRVYLSLIRVALVADSVRKWPQDKGTCKVSLFEEYLVSLNKIMLTDTKTEKIAAELGSNADKCIA